MSIRTEPALETLERTGIIAVVRTSHTDGLLTAFERLYEGGIALFEITMTVPGALEIINDARRHFGGALAVGAGTVLDAGTAKAAIAAGACFIVSPALDAGVLATCRSEAILALPGCLTPTEVAAALGAGADVIKLFPGRVATPAYLHDLLGPFPRARFVPTGNVDLEATRAYIGAGAVAVGVGKALLEARSLESGDDSQLTSVAAAFRLAIDETRARAA